MTEADWLVSTNPQVMLAHLSGLAREGELRQFAAACCRRIWHLLPQPRDEFQRVLQLAQSAANDIPDDPNRARVYAAAAASCAAFAAAAAESVGPDAEAFAAHAVYAASALTGAGYADEEAMVWSVAADASAADEATCSENERAAQAELIRKLFGNPFRSENGNRRG